MLLQIYDFTTNQIRLAKTLQILKDYLVIPILSVNSQVLTSECLEKNGNQLNKRLNTSMNILPKTGIDKIRLGMSKQEITKLLGQPISTESNPDDDIWEFKNDIELSFQKDDDYLLSSILTSNPLALLESKKIIGISEAEFFTNFPDFQLDEDFGGNGKSYWSDELQLMAWIFEDDVFNITIYPEYRESDDTPIWPKKIF